jgi:flagellin-like hook-associated protein FlgL
VLSALLSLAKTQTQLTTYQKQMSSGLRVAMPSDDPIAWAQAQRLLAQSSVLGAAQGSLVQATSVTQIAAGARNRGKSPGIRAGAKIGGVIQAADGELGR